MCATRSFTATSIPATRELIPTVAGYPGDDAYSGQIAGWTEDVFDLTPFAGADVAIRFRFDPDGSTTDRWLGFFLGTVFLYTSLLGVGYSLTGRPAAGATLVALSGIAALLALRVGRREARITV